MFTQRAISVDASATTRTKKRTLRPAAGLLLAALLAVPAAADTTIIARDFAPLPTIPGTLSFPGDATINNAGQVKFFASLTPAGPTPNPVAVLFRANPAFDGYSYEQLVAGGQASPDGNGALDMQLMSSSFATAFNDRGAVGFSSAVSGLPATGEGVFLAGDPGLQVLARTGQAVPGGNGGFGMSFDNIVTSGAGVTPSTTLFKAGLQNTAGGPGVDDVGLYRWQNGSLSTVARSGQPAPGGGVFQLFSPPGGASETAWVTAGGQVGFIAGISTGGTPGSGVFIDNNGAKTLVARSGQAVPGGNGTFGTFSATPNGSIGIGGLSPARIIDDSGRMVFTSTINNTDPGAESGIYLRETDGTIIEVARAGGTVPGGSGTFGPLDFSQLTMNAAGDIAFTANENPSGTSLFLRKQGGEMVRVASSSMLNQFALSDDGLLAYQITTIESPTAEIWVTDGTDSARVASVGQDVGDGRVVTDFISLGQQSINTNRQILFTANTDVAGAEFPTPANTIIVTDLNLRWAGGAAGSWDNALDWSENTTPTGLHDVYIQPAGNTTVAGPAGDARVRTLSLGGGNGIARLEMNGGSLESVLSAFILPTGVLAGVGTVDANLINEGTIAPTNLNFLGQLNNSSGVILGGGRIAGSIFNGANGQVRVDQDLVVGSVPQNGQDFLSNSGLITVTGATLTTQIHFNNEQQAQIVLRNAELNSQGAPFDDLNNRGQIIVNGGVNDLFIAIDNTNTGRFVVTGNSIANFYKPFHNDGAMHVAAGSTAAFFDDYTGAGLITGAGVVEAYGEFNPGNSPAEITIEGDLLLAATSMTVFELGGIAPGSQYDRVVVEGEASLLGEITVVLIDGFTPSSGQQFEVLTAGSFGDIDLSRVFAPSGLQFTVTPNSLILVSQSLPGDTDGDGDIDDADLGTLISNFTGPVGAAGGKTTAQGDTDADGDIDDADLGNLISNFTGPLGPANVPEPASAVLLAFGAAALARRRRR